jgi:MFS family permease
MLRLLARHSTSVLLGTFAATATFVIFYLMTVFTLSWGTQQLGFTRPHFLILQMIGVLCFGAFIPLSAYLAQRYGAIPVVILASAAIAAFGLTTASLFGSGTATGTLTYLCVGLALMGLTYGPLGTALAQLFPTEVRYTGASLTFNLAGVVGASVAPYVATWLASTRGLAWVGYYLCAAGVLSLFAALAIHGRSQASPPMSL